jgi:serine/threonine-protein kinase
MEELAPIVFMSQASQPAYGWLSVPQPSPDAEAVRLALARLTSSAIFADSQRMARFLRFAVEETLQGNGSRLKEIVIGAEVFDRGAAYDPRLDPIVRVEARRLRAKLRAYYESQGRDDQLIIEFPKGTYQPVFKLRSQSATSAAPRTGAAAIVILPFANLDPAPDQQYFSDGLTEELIHALTRIPDLRVIAWNTATHFRAEQDIENIRTRLGVSYILRGAVRRTGQRLRITAQLIDALTGEYVWSDTYNREVQDVFAIQEQIALVIVNALQLRLGSPAPASRGHNLECFNLCLKGRYHANERTAEGMRRAAICFEQAVAMDVTSALAYAGLTDSYTLLADYGFIDAGEVMEKARAAAEKAVELDANSAEAYTSLAWIRSRYEWRWGEADALYRRAIELNPGYATAHHWYASDYLALMGRYDEAMAEAEIARCLDPLSMIVHECLGFILMLCRRYDDAITVYRRMLEMDPSFYKSHTSLGRVYIQCGRYAEAIHELQQGRRIAGDVPNILAAMGQAHALAGDREQAGKLLDEVTRLAQTRFVPSTSFALLHTALGNREAALDYLEKAAARRELQLCIAKVHPAYNPLRAEPRFQAVLKRAGFV